MFKNRLLNGVLLTTLLALIAWSVLRPHPLPQTAWSYQLQLPLNQTQRYNFSYQGNEQIGNSFSKYSFAGAFTLTALESGRVLFLLSNLEEVKIFNQGSLAMNSESEELKRLQTEPVLLEISPQGEVVSYAFDGQLATQNSHYTQVLQFLLKQLFTNFAIESCTRTQGHLCDRWNQTMAQEIGLLKTAIIPHETELKLTIRPKEYAAFNFPWDRNKVKQVIEGERVVELDPQYWLKKMEGTFKSKIVERTQDKQIVLAQSESALTLSLDSSTPVSNRRIPKAPYIRPRLWNKVALNSYRGGAATERSIYDLLQSDRLTREDIYGMLSTYAFLGTTEMVPHFYQRAIHLIRYRPELVQDLKQEFLMASFFPKERALILELLAGSGLALAQKTMQELLSTTKLEDPQWNELLPKLVLVARPNKEMIEWIYDVLEKELTTPSARLTATLYTAASLAESIKDEQELNDHYRKITKKIIDFEPNNDEEIMSKAQALAALSEPTFLAELEEYRQARNPLVQAAIAQALRKQESSDSLDWLIHFITNGPEEAGLAALHALEVRTAEQRRQGILTICQDRDFKERFLSENFYNTLIAMLDESKQFLEAKHCLTWLLKKNLPLDLKKRVEVVMESYQTDDEKPHGRKKRKTL